MGNRAIGCFENCSDNKSTVHHITNSIWIGEHKKGNSTHYCVFNDKTDDSILSLVTEGDECPCMDKILTHPNIEMQLVGPIAFMGHLRDVCDEMKMVRNIDIEIVNHGMPCKRCIQLKISEGDH